MNMDEFRNTSFLFYTLLNSAALTYLNAAPVVVHVSVLVQYIGLYLHILTSPRRIRVNGKLRLYN